MYLLGSHVGMSGKDMMLGSVKTALSYGANTFMLYTGAPQNTRRKKIEELNIPAAILINILYIILCIFSIVRVECA